MKRLFASSAAPLVSLLAIVGLTTVVMLAVRIYIVEPEPVALACAASSAGWRCWVRAYAVIGFLHNVFGITSLLAAVLAIIVRLRWLALLAMLAGVAGAVLYTFELSGMGLLLGALVWVHRAPTLDSTGSPEANTQRSGEQQA
jgi:hypothetical protein